MLSERYQRLDLIGQGPMSVVWLAFDTYKQERVALKIMTAIQEDDRRNQRAQERFQREISIARSLKHAHILPIRDSGYTTYEEHRVPYLVSPYMQEGSLADLIKICPPWQCWTLSQTADVIMQAASALGYLHQHTPPIVHEDVKPANFLYRSMQTPERIVHLYLSDFGISRWDRTTSTVASELLGTFAFMAPEQIERKVDCASDQYSLAIMACYFLTGKLPIQASTNELYIHAHLHEPPQAPSALNSERINSPEIDAVILRALAKQPAQRFATVQLFGQALQQAIMQQMQEQAEVPTEPDDFTTLPTTLMQPGRTLTQMSSSPISGISIALDPPDIREDRVLDEPLPARPMKVATAKHEEVIFMLLHMQGVARIPLFARPRQLSWTPDGTSFACLLYGSLPPVYVQKNTGLQAIHTLNSTQATSICWSPDNQTLAVAAQGEIRFWDTVNQTELPLAIQVPVRTIEGLDWSSNEQLAVWVNDQIRIYALPASLLMHQQPSSPQILSTGVMRCGHLGALSWSSDGTCLVGGASNGSIMCWCIGRLAATWQVAPAGQKVNSLAWSPDGTMLAAAFKNNRVAAWDMSAQHPLFNWEKLPALPRMLSISPAKRIAIASSEKRILIGRSHEPFPSTMIPGQLLGAWSPTAEELVTLDEDREQTLTIWHA